MNTNTLLLEETIDNIIRGLNQLKKRKDIEEVEINIHKQWMGDYYVTEFKVNYNIVEVNKK